jgi:hypothetical protein
MSAALADDDSRKRKDPDADVVDLDRNRVRVFPRKIGQSGHVHDNVESIAHPAQKWRSGASDPKAPSTSRRFADAGVSKILKPEIDVFGRATRALKKRRAHADQHVADAERIESEQECPLALSQ